MITVRLRGFTLIELIAVMLVISIGVVTLAGLFSTSAKSLTANETEQQVTQAAQACAEWAIANRRDNKFSATATLTCPTVSGITPSAVVSAIYTSAGSPACNSHSSPCPCPSGGTVNCRDVAITATQGGYSSQITVMLADY